MPSIRFTLNGKETVASYEKGMHLLEVLREECGIISAKNGCAPEGACGCCLVTIDGTPALSCLRKPEQVIDQMEQMLPALMDLPQVAP